MLRSRSSPRAGTTTSSLEEIASSAGISKALIYEHFPSKRELPRGAAPGTTFRSCSRSLAEAAASAQPGELRLRAGVDAFLRFVEERRDGWRMLFRESVGPGRGGRPAGDAGAGDDGRRGADRRRARAAADGAPRRRRAIEMLAQQLTGAIQSLANWWAEHPEVPRHELVEQVMAFAWLGLERLRDGERYGQPA